MTTTYDEKAMADHTVDANSLEEKNVKHSEVLANTEVLNDAYDGENREHQMGALEAVRKHPMACFWAFIMSFTIVRLRFRQVLEN